MTDAVQVNPELDPRMLTFSQAQGYEELPGPLQLEELPKEARIRIWNVFYSFLLAYRRNDYGIYLISG